MTKRFSVPTYRLHRRTGRAIITVYDTGGSRRDVLLPGLYHSDESRKEYERLLAVLRTNRGTLHDTKESQPNNLTVAEVVLSFMEQHVAGYYVNSTGQPTSEQVAIKQAAKPLVRLFADLPGVEFGPLNLRTVRESMLTGSWMTDQEKDKRVKNKHHIGLARTTTNKHIGRIKQIFRWASEMQLIPAAVYHGLATVAGLRRGRGGRETNPVLPVDPETVEQVIPHLPCVVADMIRLLLWTGARVGELCRLRTSDLDRSGPIWLYHVERHKTSHHGHTRTIPLGPKAQFILRRYLKADPDLLIFTPAEQDRLIKEKMRAERKTSVQPSQIDRCKIKPRHKPGERFDHNAINHALRRVCKRINVQRFHVHQLRHTAALIVMREHGIEAARSVLGHKTVNMTLHYSGIDLEKAKEVASKIG